MLIDPFGQAYLRLTLEIDKHIDGYIDAYLGPDELKAEVNAAAKKPASALLDDLAQLRDTIPADDPARQAYLTAQFRAIECTLLMLNGQTFDYLEEVRRIYDINPQLTDEAVFTQAHAALDTVLPGSGSLVERLNEDRKRFEIATEKALPLLEMTLEEARGRTRHFVTLVEGEAIELRLTKDQPWGAYNWYLGNGRSLVEFNTDLPTSALGLLNTMAHEGYPGHHTEHQLKEKHLLHDKGYAECASFLLHSPAAVIAEGIATTAQEIIFPGDTAYEYIALMVLPAAGIQGVTAAELSRKTEAGKHLRTVTNNAAILYHTGQLNEAQTLDYLQTYALVNERRARQSFRFMSNPLFRSYGFTYTQGYQLIEQASQGDKTTLFKRLLVEQMLPSQLGNGINQHP
ncbi:MAG: hypothetical protein KA314_08885 [Chloroflexi bacterium]|nr:hypothetical protein [Chloroflexota bacterium]MBP8055944.1 hypothetical protein [Chloroflexota bacterium]